MPTTTNRWVITIATFFGVSFRIHTTFFAFFAWVVLTTGQGWEHMGAVGLLFLGIFGSVLLHELGHVVAARLFRIPTQDITLYPFGGIARLARAPIAKEEFWIALAGPAVSVGIALALEQSGLSERSVVVRDLIHTNFLIALFNMIPAIPMDGGRILRSLLELLGNKNATLFATRLSQGCSIMLVVAGIYFGSPMLIIIAVVVGMGAVQEAVIFQTKHAIVGKLTKELMIERDKLYEFSHGTTLSDALPIALKALQDVFPVLYNAKLIGIVDRNTLVEAATGDPENQYLSSLMTREFVSVDASSLLADTMNISQEKNLLCIPVLEGEDFVGFLFPQHVADFMMVDSVRAETQHLQEELDNDDSY